MPTDQENQDLIKRVTEAAVKAIAGQENVTVAFGPGAHGISATEEGSQARLPAPIRSFGEDDLSILRGEADALALRLRFNNSKTYGNQIPIGSSSAELFDTAEQVRVEALGSQILAGVSKNLDEYHEARCKEKGYHLVTERDQAQIVDAMGMLLREKLTGKPTPRSALPLMEAWRSWLDHKAGEKIDQLRAHLDNQEEFGRTIKDILEDLELPSETEGEKEGDQGDQDNLDDSEDENTEDDLETEQEGKDESSSSEDLDLEGLDPDMLEDMEDIGEVLETNLIFTLNYVIIKLLSMQLKKNCRELKLALKVNIKFQEDTCLH